MKTRTFNKNSERKKVYILMRCLMNAISEHPEITFTSPNHKTDLIGIACQYNKSVRREDFDMIKDMKIENIIDMFNHDWK